MFVDYQLHVLQDYKEKRAMDKLSFNLTNPTTAKLRAECVTVFEKRYKKKDEKIIEGFFGHQRDDGDYLLAIRRFDVDKFRPLNKFLNENVNNPDRKNIELLAWLIDFEPRPYKLGYNRPANQLNTSAQTAEAANEVLQKPVNDDIKKEESIELEVGEITNGRVSVIEEVSIESDDKEQHSSFEQIGRLPIETPALKFRKGILLFLVLAFMGVGGYLIFEIYFTANGKCMYWTGDRYQQTSCINRMNGIATVAFDTAQLTHFKRITAIDTITPKAIGHVWYIKIDNSIEYYTSGGFHPVHSERRLKPITNYIINKYLNHH